MRHWMFLSGCTAAPLASVREHSKMRLVFHKPQLLLCAGLLGCLVLWNHPALGHSRSASSKVKTPTAYVRFESGKEWPLIDGDSGNSRYSTLSQINTQTIKNLGGAWMSKQFDDGALSRSAPVVQDGQLFVTAGSRIYAFDAKTGATIWSYQTDSRPGPSSTDNTIGQTTVIFSGRGLPDNQGVAVGEGMVFAGLTDGQVIAVDAKTGKLVWSKQTGEEPPKLGQSVTDAPTYAQGIVFAGMGNGDLAIRGRVVALDSKTGRELWHFIMIPGPGEVGHNSWPDDDTSAWKIGGSGVWQTGAVDPELGLVYYGGGNAVPQWAGELRAGDNLFTNSVVALDMKTGKLRWYYQVLHHELWDADIGTSVVLYDAEMGGRLRKGVAVMRSDGYLFLLDRETGKPLIPIEERAVPQNEREKTSPTQPFPVGADSLLPDCSTWEGKLPAGFVLGCSFFPPSFPPPSTDPQNVLAPGFSVRIAPFSYSPQTQYFYAQGAANLAWRRRTYDPYYFSTRNGGHLPIIPEKLRPGVIAAIDSRTDKIVWKKEVVPSLLGRSGSLVTAGGLMFHGSGDGNFQAYDAKTGDMVWQFQTGIGGGGGPAASYEIEGEQYMAYVAGSSVWAFKLGGSVRPLPAPRLPSTETITGPIEDTNHVDTAALLVNNGDLGTHYFVDEYLFGPFRARVEAGTRVTWKNNGSQVHTVVAIDGSWTTGTLRPTDAGSVMFDKPGTYTYICKDHPWSYGQIIVEPKKAQGSGQAEGNLQSSQIAGGTFNFRDQVNRGKAQYAKSCSNCHVDDLSGRDAAPALAGDAFALRWEGRTVRDLFDRIRTTMPLNSTDRLSLDADLDIVAYVLQVNNLLSGNEELKIDSPGLSQGLKKN